MRIPQRNDIDTSASMTPLIDVVFLLIIFFLVSSHLARREQLLPVELPTAGQSRPSDPDDARLTMTLDADGRLFAKGREIAFSEVGILLNDHFAADDRVPAVRLRGDGSVAYRNVAPVLREIIAAGCSDIVVATRKTSPSQTSPPKTMPSVRNAS